MRKSASPSVLKRNLKFNVPYAKNELISPSPLIEKENSINKTTASQPGAPPDAVRSTAEILKLITGTPDDCNTNESDEENNKLDEVIHPSSKKKRPNRTYSLGVSKKLHVDTESSQCINSVQDAIEPDLTSEEILAMNSSGKNMQLSKNSIYFNVVWCKKSTRKHKKWEGDAILIVKGCSAILKDMEGKEMARGIGYKIKEVTGLEEGSQFFIGGKECEIQYKVSEEDYSSGKCFNISND